MLHSISIPIVSRLYLRTYSRSSHQTKLNDMQIVLVVSGDPLILTKIANKSVTCLHTSLLSSISKGLPGIESKTLASQVSRAINFSHRVFTIFALKVFKSLELVPTPTPFPTGV